MKQLLSLFLFLLPCLALAQYPSNGNQKITLGEQTTADGLIFRGVLADTLNITPLSDTSAYIILDTANHRFYNYNRATNVWSIAGGVTTFSAGTTGLTPSTATSGAVTLAGTLAVANGGTGSATQNFVDLTTTQSSIAGAKTFTSALTATRFNPTANTATGTGMFSPDANTLGFSTIGINRVIINSNGSFGIGITPGNFDGLTFADPFFDVAGNMQLKGTAANGSSNLSMGGLIYRKAGIFTSIDGESPNFSFYVGTSYNNSSVSLLMYADSLQRLGIGTTTPSEKLHVVGNAKITNVGSVSASNSPLYVTSTGVLSTSSSDINKKHNIRNLPYGLNTINQLNPVAFDWNETDETDIGFIAQDIESIIPESVITNWDSQLIFRQEKIVPILVKAIQEQQAQIEALKQRLLILENK